MEHRDQKRKLRIAVLVPETNVPFIAAKHGDMFSLFEQAFQRSIASSSLLKGVQLEMIRFDVISQPPQYPSQQDLKAGTYDGFVITGSSKTAHDDQPWINTLMQFIRDLKSSNVPLLGVCFGHQIIARALGGVCEENPKGWEFGPTLIQLNQQGQSFLRSGNKNHMCLNQIHQDHVPYLPPGFIQLATTSPHTAIQAMVSADGQCLCIQGHPEITCDATTTFLDFLEPQIPTSVVQSARDRLHRLADDMDDHWLTEKILLFFLGDLSPIPDEQTVPTIAAL